MPKFRRFTTFRTAVIRQKVSLRIIAPASDPMQIEDAFKDPEDRFWDKNSSEGTVRNSEVQLKPKLFRTRLIGSPRYFEEVVLSIHLKSILLFRTCQQKSNKKKLPSDQQRVRSVKQSTLSLATVCLLLREPRFEGKQAAVIRQKY